MIERIKYFTYHGNNNPSQLRFNSPASDTKVDYIVSVLNRCGLSVDQISPAPSSSSHYLPSIVLNDTGNTLRFFSSFGQKNKYLSALNNWYISVQFFIWCLFNIKKGELVLVYHSLGYARTFYLLKKLLKIHIIGEIEELYQDVNHKSPRKCKYEYDFVDCCEKYLFPTELLNERLNLNHKPYIVIHGVYSFEPSKQRKYDDGKVHVVYGGTLTLSKGSEVAAKSALFLPANYHIHICGFGSASEKDAIEQIVKEISSKSKATITFEGELKGKDYNDFIQKCHIGLCTQDPKASFTATSFPSKILVYLSNGLKVVSIKIPAIFDSKVSEAISFYEEQQPKEVAETIIKCSSKTLNGKELLERLDSDFKESFEHILTI